MTNLARIHILSYVKKGRIVFSVGRFRPGREVKHNLLLSGNYKVSIKCPHVKEISIVSWAPPFFLLPTPRLIPPTYLIFFLCFFPHFFSSFSTLFFLPHYQFLSPLVPVLPLIIRGESLHLEFRKFLGKVTKKVKL